MNLSVLALLGIFGLASALAYYAGRIFNREEKCNNCLRMGLELGYKAAHAKMSVEATPTADGKGVEMKVEENV